MFRWFSIGSSGRATSDFRCGCDWFSVFHETRVVAASGLWNENWIPAEGSKVPEFCAAGPESLRKRKCLQKTEEG